MHRFDVSRSRALACGLLLACACTLVTATASAATRSSGTNALPVISGSPATVATVGVAYRFRPSASDANGDTLRFMIISRPGWASFDSRTGTLYGVPGSKHVGTYGNIVIAVSDGRRGSSWVSLPPFSITVANGTNTAPTIAGTPSPSVVAGQAYDFAPTARDADGNALRFAISNRPTWATFDTGTGRLRGTPDASFAGITFSNVVISVTDGVATSSLAPFSVTVEAGNRAPTIGGTPATSAPVGQAYGFQPTASDPDGQALTFSIANRPAWATFSTSTGRLSGTPTSSHVGTYGGIAISASDGTASVSLPAFSITVASVNQPPTISGAAPTSVTAGQAYSFQPSASDPDGSTLTFNITNRPSWATFSSSTGRLSGTPSTTDVGTYGNIVISVSDGTSAASLGAFSIAVMQGSNGSVTLSWSPPTTNSDGSPLVDLAGYRIVYGQASGQYTQVVDVPTAAVTSAMIENLAPSTWYFAVKAYTRTGIESAPSREAYKTIL